MEYEKGDRNDVLAAGTIAWTAGVTANPLIKNLPISNNHKNKRGYLKVNSTMQQLEYSEVFAGGDCALNDGANLPQTAQVAD